ncbi:MarR family winged helix-turn-helix transcriptional regulator [Nocardia sp. alder85J]|uniref:MarR family winged helix-turn-helix transcriptional regulator n=1 Tax=Nocardia sp. alder85J TaxID=2862949 RepID=UPI001CD739C3|nr:MarR family transcriptional regulator [Nocardia sp. alder85J]MCX4095507.1 MarR family transcriptional regulator [Nocardia sp. alder85J]
MVTSGSEWDAGATAARLRLAVGRITRKLRQAKAGASGLALSELSVLARLDREGSSSPTALAAAEGVRPQAMAVTLATLEERGLITRRPDESDGRRAVVSIGPPGRGLVADRRSQSARYLADAIEREFTAAERHVLEAALPLLDRLAERL